jgi:hypothetical protein
MWKVFGLSGWRVLSGDGRFSKRYRIVGVWLMHTTWCHGTDPDGKASGGGEERFGPVSSAGLLNEVNLGLAAIQPGCTELEKGMVLFTGGGCGGRVVGGVAGDGGVFFAVSVNGVAR